MAGKYGYSPIILAFDETAFNDAVTGYDTTYWQGPDKLEIKPVRSPIETQSKTGQVTEMAQEKLGGRYYYEWTLTGDLGAHHEGLLKAFFGDTASPYVPNNSSARKSFEIMRYTLDDKADIIKGAVVKNFRITGETNGVIQFEATGWAAAYSENTSVAAYASFLTIADEDWDVTPFLFGDSTIGINTETSDWEAAFSAEISLENIFDDDKFLFLNNNALQGITINKMTGTTSFATTYDTTNGDIDADEMYRVPYDATGHGPEEDGLNWTLTDGDATWTIVTHGVMTDYTRADPDRQLFESSGSHLLQGYYAAGTYTAPITITVS